MNPIFQNAVDSLAVGIRFYLSKDEANSQKHAILAIFHAIELFLKEYLFRIHPNLVYRNIDQRICDDSPTVGARELPVRLENFGLELPKVERKVVQALQARRNRIEHLSYEKLPPDPAVLGESLKFITFFVESVLNERLADHLDNELLSELRRVVFTYDELAGMAERRLHEWLRRTFGDWDSELEDLPEGFDGTLPCPACRQDYLVVDNVDRPHCFFCDADVDAGECGICGRTYLRAHGPCCQPAPS